MSASMRSWAANGGAIVVITADTPAAIASDRYFMRSPEEE
jgi:hypothetical protein